MLFVWLFALGASWVNACILQPSDATQNLRGHPERSGFVAHGGSGHEGAGNAGAPHEPDPAQEACASFCDTEQSVVAKVQPAKGDGAVEPSAQGVLVFGGWPAITRGQTEVRWRPFAVPPPPAAPVVIAFLRLTL